MPKVENHSGKGIPLLRWRVLPDGRVLDPQGKICDELPDDVGYSDQAKRLCAQNCLKIEGINLFPKAEAPKPPPPPDPGVPERVRDDLTELVHIGKGRARKLVERGVESYQDVVDLGARKLDSALDLTGQQAEEVVEDAAGRLE